MDLRLLLPLVLWTCLNLAFVPPAAAAADEPAPGAIGLGAALALGPLPLPLPAFHDAERHGLTLAQLLEARSLDAAAVRPVAGDEVPLAGGGRAAWRKADAPYAWPAPADAPAEAWLACYLRSDRWQKAKLVLDAPEGVHVQAWLDGAAVTLKEDAGELDLPRGTRLLLLRTVAAAGLAGDWTLAPRLEPAAAAPAGEDAAALLVVPTTSRRRVADVALVLDAPRVTNAVLSPDGTLAALQLVERNPGGARQQWLEVRRVPEGDLATTWRGGDLAHLQWAPQGRRLSFAQTSEKLSDLWLLDLDSGAAGRLVRGIADLRGYRWSPDGTFVVYAVREEAKPDERRIKHVENPADRQAHWRHRSHLVLATVPDGVTRRLTAGPLDPDNWSLSPDGKRLLFFLADQDLAGGRPFFTSELWELDLATLRAERLLDDRWLGGAAYGPDPDRLLLQGSPSAFAGLGRDLPDGVQANDYGGQLYLYDRRRGEAEPLTRDFDPAVGDAWWSLDDGLIYALCTDTQFRNVWRADPRRPRWERVEVGVEYVDQFDLARQGRRALVRGTSVTTPNRVFSVDLRRNRGRLLHDPGREAWRDVAFGEVQHWQAPLPDGETLDGRIYWPVDYDPTKTYPVIVYYYGGTTPVTVDFGGRYPKNVWTGEGYIVYVPQPSGAIGYGQAFAARHVNDWGRRTAWEVIEGTKAFLQAFPAADSARVGCIGASYGGFLTMYLLTQTDIFAAGVSHAGIASIASYWGEGLWGYVYGARALAGAFPWNDRDLYIEQSALFHADRITTPLLLVHGASDTNVPVGESDQLFTALKLLGREVEYVQILGQDHHILDREQRIVWNDTILAFFARWLKDEPAWWQALHPRR
jgi:dipeptidyl aminopeptidase/acylaminoacyl peptidase